jgi:hypothetical protein
VSHYRVPVDVSAPTTAKRGAATRPREPKAVRPATAASSSPTAAVRARKAAAAGADSEWSEF